MSENVSSPEEETGLQGNSKLCINVKYNTAVPDFSSSSKEETEVQRKSEMCNNTKYNTTIHDNIEIQDNKTKF